MTPKERETFDAFVTIEDREGRAALLREVAAERGVSHTVIYEQVEGLVRKGLLKKARGDNRSGTYMTVTRCPICFQSILRKRALESS